jgi:murein DD-endopeptidase MepM/ murein hydrolase activator NlpD
MKLAKIWPGLKDSSRISLIAGLIMLSSGITSCTQAVQSCYEQPYADLSEALTYSADDQLPFQYPLDELGLEPYRDQYGDHTPARFCRGSWEKEGEEHKRKFHAAEDYHLPAGSPVYAFADGEISFSGRMGGYGWLIIIDHPQHNIYSLYGHLSPSRWSLESGTPVEKGDLIGYLGDSDENGGSKKNPLVTHLHFALRVGQRTDYPGQGEWRWMAGWIKPCPSEVGWLKPSQVITSQEIPQGGYPIPEGSFFEKWRGEIFLLSIYVVVGAVALVNSIRKKNRIFPIVTCLVMVLTGLYFSTKHPTLQYGLYAIAVAAFGVVLYQYLQGSTKE